ncbi:MAG: hypothetical protein KJ914_17630 [Gammaproteobacteria bacterium]|nr:hypothetical protein [Gammaproteobacteria bacterium]MBU1724305.1 hypothetical protein [Gammaproteobacteria bacterium]MBU2006267.1 hypothetical protein [Gammaproteobacteria bacterium]
MKLLLTIGLASLLTACANTVTTTQVDVQSVTFVSTSGTVAPPYWRGVSLIVGKDLTTKQVTTGSYGSTTLDTKSGTITQAQFDELVKALSDADFTHVKSTALTPPPVGGGISSLTVQTDKGKYEFFGPSTYTFPPAIGSVFEMRGQYMPQGK